MSDINNKVVTRFAPSPTGLLHLGTFRTAIFSYLYAKRNNGKFILRIEDTDRERSKKEYEENILESLKWLGMEYDEMYRQSENVSRHRFYLEKMIAEGNAYISKEEAKDGSGVIKEIVRFKNPNEVVSFQDEIKGLVTVDTTDLGDFVIAKNMNEPLFHLAVVVDDFEEGVTHIIRGEDHVSNTPRQILIQRAIGAPTPIYAHLPLVLGEDKLKLSKRRGALDIGSYRNKGFIPEAILNGVVFIGWNPGTEKEIFTKSELEESFDLKQVQKSPAVFNEVKLKWFNKEHIRLLSSHEQEKYVLEFLPENIKNFADFTIEKFRKILPVIIERIECFSEVAAMSESGELDYFFHKPKVSIEILICPEKLRKGAELSYEDVKMHLKKVSELLSGIPGDGFDAETIKTTIWDYATEHGRGIVLWAMRTALSGMEKSPDPFQISAIIGKDETLSRLTNAISL
jgi:glutamyl-tRNA synthetase